MPGVAGDPRRPDRVQRYVPSKQAESSSADQINAVGMVCSLLGLLIKVNMCSIVALIIHKPREVNKLLMLWQVLYVKSNVVHIHILIVTTSHSNTSFYSQ